MTIRPIRSDEDHAAALERIDARMQAEPGTPDADELEILAVLVSAYEARRWSIDPPEPIEAIKFHMEQNGFRRSDLAAIIGSASRASEISTGRRKLTVKMIQQIHAKWKIPLESLIGVASDRVRAA
jgi:HTH-type transcriptional regulator/antitoxin HigA